MHYLKFYDVKSRWPKAVEIVQTYFEDGELDDPDETFYMVNGNLACYVMGVEDGDSGLCSECFWNESLDQWEDEDGNVVGTYDEEYSDDV